MIPATPSVEFGCAPSLRQQALAALFHGGVLIILLLANLPHSLMIVVGMAVAGLYLWQRFVLAQRCGWRLRFERDHWHLDKGDGNWMPLTCEIHYLSRWLVALTLVSEQERHNLALFSDGMQGDDWRLLHVIARGMLRKPQGRLTMMS